MTEREQSLKKEIMAQCFPNIRQDLDMQFGNLKDHIRRPTSYILRDIATRIPKSCIKREKMNDHIQKNLLEMAADFPLDNLQNRKM